jgi:hypothetical protein
MASGLLSPTNIYSGLANFPNAKAQELIGIQRGLLTEGGVSKFLLNQTKTLIGTQKVAVNAYAELMSFVLAEQVEDSYIKKSQLLATDDDGNEFVTGNFNGNFKGNLCVGETLNDCENAQNSFFVNSVTAGQLDNVIIGGSNPLEGTFTTVTADSIIHNGTDLQSKLDQMVLDRNALVNSTKTELEGKIETAKHGLQVKAPADYALIGSTHYEYNSANEQLKVLDANKTDFESGFGTADTVTYDTNLTIVVSGSNNNSDGLWIYKEELNSDYIFERAPSANFADPNDEVIPGTAFIVKNGDNSGTYVVTSVTKDGDNLINGMVIVRHTATNFNPSQLQTDITANTTNIVAQAGLIGTNITNITTNTTNIGTNTTKINEVIDVVNTILDFMAVMDGTNVSDVHSPLVPIP